MEGNVDVLQIISGQRERERGETKLIGCICDGGDCSNNKNLR